MNNPKLPLAVILLAYLALGLQYAALTPAWQVPDEPAHYNYIRHIVETGRLPILQIGDYDQAYLSRLTGEYFPPDLPVDPVRYESWQPPLYYLLMTPVFLLFHGALLPLRLFSLFLGAGVIVFAFLVVREVVGRDAVGRDAALPLLAAGFIAFIPQHVAMMAGVNNDSLSELLIAIGLYFILRANRLGVGNWKLGFVIGLALVTKVAAYVLVPVAAVRLLLNWQRVGWGEWRLVVRQGVIVFGIALAFGLLFWGRNLAVYGWPDFLASARHSLVVAEQPRTSQWAAQYGSAEVARRFLVTTFQSFWGQFGWMGVVMDRRVYLALLLYSIGLAVGAVATLSRQSSREAVSSRQRDGVIILSVSGLLTLAVYLSYNLDFVQHQGRYLFPALIPIGLAAAVGLQQWAKWAAAAMRRLPHVSRFTAQVEILLPFLPLALMAALCLFALYRFILPALVL